MGAISGAYYFGIRPGGICPSKLIPNASNSKKEHILKNGPHTAPRFAYLVRIFRNSNYGQEYTPQEPILCIREVIVGPVRLA